MTITTGLPVRTLYALLLGSSLLAPVMLAGMLLDTRRGLSPAPGPSGGLVVMDPILKAGRLGSYQLHFCTDVAVPIVVQLNRELELLPVDYEGIVSILAPSEFVMTEPCEVREFLFPVPDVIPSGQYVIRLYTKVTINPLQTRARTWVSTAFAIE